MAAIRQCQQSPDYERIQKARSHPLDTQLRQWLQIARLAGAELGLSPVSRARVAPAGQGQEIDELEDFITTPLRRVR